jgi:hypothetical protein
MAVDAVDAALTSAVLFSVSRRPQKEVEHGADGIEAGKIQMACSVWRGCRSRSPEVPC